MDELDPEELEAARRLARLVDGEELEARGDEDELLEAAALVRALGPGTEDPEGLEAVEARLMDSLAAERSHRGARRVALSLVALAACALFMTGAPRPADPEPTTAPVEAPEWPEPPRRLRPSELFGRRRIKVSQLVRRRIARRRKPWSARFARDS